MLNLEYFFIYPIISKIAEKLIDTLFYFFTHLWTFCKDLYNNELFIGYYSYNIQHKTFLVNDRRSKQIIGEDNNYLIESLKLWIGEISKKSEQKKIKLFLSKYDEMTDISENNNKRTLCVMPESTIYHNGIYYKYRVKNNVSAEKDHNNIIDESITLYSKKTIAEIKNHVNEIYENFLKKYINFTINENKYYLELQQKNKDSDDNVFKTYELKVSKTFEDLFFDKKEVILKLLSDFEKGKINKLALLLSGPPGTGKTSIIKAIINKTNRCVISIKLNNVKNITQLSHLIHCDNFMCESDENKDYSSLNIPKSKRIYIFEDVDADTDILFDRTNKDSEVSDKKIIKNLLNNLSANNEESSNASKKENNNKFFRLDDELTLSDILNIFDGIREISESIIIFTTNHPDKLDSAFIRPGRITYHLEMNKITNEIAKKYIEYIFKESADYKIKDFAITMAELEGYCRISENIQDLKIILSKENLIIS